MTVYNVSPVSLGSLFTGCWGVLGINPLGPLFSIWALHQLREKAEIKTSPLLLTRPGPNWLTCWFLWGVSHMRGRHSVYPAARGPDISSNLILWLYKTREREPAMQDTSTAELLTAVQAVDATPGVLIGGLSGWCHYSYVLSDLRKRAFAEVPSDQHLISTIQRSLSDQVREILLCTRADEWNGKCTPPQRHQSLWGLTDSCW